MAINIKNLEELIQKKAYAVTSSTPTSDLGDIVEASLLATNSLREYDSAGALPAATSNEKIAFVKSDKSVRFNNGSKWDTLTSGAAQAGAAGVISADNISQGLSYGYSSGGEPSTSSPFPLGGNNTIAKFSFTSDGNATDVGDLASSQGGAGRHDGTIALQMGGTIFPTNTMTNAVQSWTFASGTDAAVSPYTLGNQANYSSRGIHQTPSHGFVTGGYRSPPLAVYSTINKFAFTNDANATTITDPSNGMQLAFHSSGSMSTTHAYFGGTWSTFTPATTDAEVLRKYPFATEDAASTDIGDMVPGTTYAGSGVTSPTHGYHTGATPASAANMNVIQKYSHSSDENASDVGDLLSPTYQHSTNQTPSYGYSAGGYTSNVIEKWPFSSDGNSSDVGDLTLSDTKYAAAVQI